MLLKGWMTNNNRYQCIFPKKNVSKLRTDNLGKRMLHHFEEEKNQSNLH